MTGKERREKLYHLLLTSKKPITGITLSEKLGVSRQIIVSDIALLRAQKIEIIATTRGYKILEMEDGFIDVIVCKHTSEQLEEELFTMVDYGAEILDVFVKHEVYGEIKGDLNISSRLEAVEFLEKIKKSNSKPLFSSTDGVHYHTIKTKDEKTFEKIKKALIESGIAIF